MRLVTMAAAMVTGGGLAGLVWLFFRRYFPYPDLPARAYPSQPAWIKVLFPSPLGVCATHKSPNPSRTYRIQSM